MFPNIFLRIIIKKRRNTRTSILDIRNFKRLDSNIAKEPQMQHTYIYICVIAFIFFIIFFLYIYILKQYE